MEQEIWKDIKGYERLYQVSSNGIIKKLAQKSKSNRSAYRNKIYPEKILKPKINHLGYAKIVLFKNGIGTKFSFHKIAATTFIPNPENKKEVNHINGIKSDNRAENLEWCTRSENVNHSFKTGLRNHRCENNSNVKLTQVDVDFIRQNCKGGLETKVFANKYNVSLSTIRRILTYKNWK